MIKKSRQKRILSILHAQGVVELAELSRLMPEISRVTLRRDIAELAEAGELKRTHGGAVLPDARILRPLSDPEPVAATDPVDASFVDGLDAIILPPLLGVGGDLLRRKVRRRGIHFLAESAAQPGGCYLGPDNHASGTALGGLAAAEAMTGADPQAEAVLLMIGHYELTNTTERCAGFEAGFRAAYPGPVRVLKVNGRAAYKTSLRAASDALQANPDVRIIFGVNDHSALAGRDAAAAQGREVAIYAAGGERPDFVAEVASGGPIRAVAAYFPEVVGIRGIDALAGALAGGGLPEACITPHAIITAATLADHYARGPRGWALKPSVRDAMVPPAPPMPLRRLRRRVGFLPQFPAHDWYRIMIQAMQARAECAGLDLVVAPPQQGVAAEIARLRRDIADAALQRIGPGETVILGEGEATLNLAGLIRRAAFDGAARVRGLTVITNAFDVLHRLQDAPGLRVILTSGEYQAADRCLVGPSLGALFERMRADKAFLSVAGVTPRFGISAPDERLALAGSRFCEAARSVIALADHTLIGADANHRIARIDAVAEVITDDGALPVDRSALRAAGVEVLVAGISDSAPDLGAAETSEPPPRAPVWEAGAGGA
jgi:DeoR/GlpR family transcriptional regulator of sugar metabolism/ABC-type sugar transport system substrate-binding protein